jgi:hypothetical protein
MKFLIARRVRIETAFDQMITSNISGKYVPGIHGLLICLFVPWLRVYFDLESRFSRSS